MKKYKINKEKCIGCGTCAARCPQGFTMGADGKSQVINSEEAEKCGGVNICPFGAIEEVSDNTEPPLGK